VDAKWDAAVNSESQPSSLVPDYFSIGESEMQKEKERQDAEWDQDYGEWLLAVKKLEKKIEKKGTSDLDRLSKAGIDRRALLRLLALAAYGSQDSLKWMRNRRDSLKSLAGRLRTLARDTKKVVDDPFSKIQWWSYLSGGRAIGMPEPTTWKDVVGVPLIPSGMEVLAKMLDKEAAQFGRFLRRVGRTDKGVVLLLTKCWMFQVLRARKPQFRLAHLDELARLLTDAFEAAGKSKTFSADGLRQIFKRHGRFMIRMWFKFFQPPEAAPKPIYTPVLQRIGSPDSLYGLALPVSLSDKSTL
jgi:hypothetical protein